LSAILDCLFSIHVFAATIHIEGHSSIHNLSTRHAVVTGNLLAWLDRLVGQLTQILCLKSGPFTTVMSQFYRGLCIAVTARCEASYFEPLEFWDPWFLFRLRLGSLSAFFSLLLRVYPLSYGVPVR